jgi:hypothetical protein
MDETFRMLGREHEADLERAAQKWRLAAEARRHDRVSELGPNASRRRLQVWSVRRAWIAALHMRRASVDPVGH